MSEAHCIFFFNQPHLQSSRELLFYWKSRNEVAGAISTPTSDQWSCESSACSTDFTVLAIVGLFHSAISGVWVVVFY